MFGLLNVNKPTGMTSRDVVNRVQRMVRPHKVGHAGTLDPLATGVLIVAIGRATRLVEYVQRMPKRYRAQFVLGCESDTEDIEGELRELPAPPKPSRAEIEAALPGFTGEIEQVPPAFSALKVQGRRAYDLARQGQTVELKARRIMVHQISLLEYAYPILLLDVHCGSGTYIRSLGRDIARSLGTAAVMSALQRTAIGDFSVDRALSLNNLTIDGIHEHLLPASTAVAAIPSFSVSDSEATDLLLGRRIKNRIGSTDDEIAAIGQDGELVGIVTPDQNDRLKPLRNFPK